MSADGAEKEAKPRLPCRAAEEVEAGKQVGFYYPGDAMLFSTGFLAFKAIGRLALRLSRRHVLRRDSRLRENAARHRTAIAGGYFLYRAAGRKCSRYNSMIAGKLMRIRFARIKALLAQAGLLECAHDVRRPRCSGESSAGAIPRGQR